jgi:hypothetical protein
MGICKQITILILYQVNFSLATLKLSMPVVLNLCQTAAR